MINVTLPQGMGLTDWADQISFDLDPYGSFGKLEDENAWQDWATQFLNNLTLQENFPQPQEFVDWREWAERFCGVLS